MDTRTEWKLTARLIREGLASGVYGAHAAFMERLAAKYEDASRPTKGAR